jgi:ATP adenylyltransferase
MGSNETGMEILWAPWRMDFIRAPRPEGCIFCEKPAQGADEENLILHRGPACFVLMNLYPYSNGHLMIAPYRHVACLEDLTPEEQAGLMGEMALCANALKAAMRPDGLNCGLNLGRAAGAGIEDHLHVHIVPRWIGDVNFMSTICSSKVIIQHLRETYAELLPHFAEAGEPVAPDGIARPADLGQGTSSS